MPATAAIVIIGDEILSGKFADQNGPFLIEELRALGVALRRIEVVPDRQQDVVDSVRRCAAACDFVFTSGGIGPTHDDVTIAAIAAAYDVEVEIDGKLCELLQGYYGEELSAAQMRLAAIPQGADLVFGDDPVWPVICFRNIYILPGVPKLFRRKFRAVRERFRAQPAVVGRVYCSVDEHLLAAKLNRIVEDFADVSFGSYPTFDKPDYRVLVTVESRDAARARIALEELAKFLGPWVVRTEEPR